MTTTATQVPVRLSWRVGPEGRPVARPWARYFFSARLVAGAPDHPFGVFLTFRPEGAVGLELLAPDLLPDVAGALTPGRRLVLFSDGRPAAGCEILSACE